MEQGRSFGPRPRVIRPLQGRGAGLALSEGVAPSYYLMPLQGTRSAFTSPRRMDHQAQNVPDK